MDCGAMLRRAIDEVEVRTKGSGFHFEFRTLGASAVDVEATCQPGQRSIVARTHRVIVRDPSDLMRAAEELVERLRVAADRLHRASPSLFFTRSQQEELGATGLVDLALDQFRGTELRAIALAPDLFVEFCLRNDGEEPLERRGVPVVPGGGGVNYILA